MRMQIKFDYKTLLLSSLKCTRHFTLPQLTTRHHQIGEPFQLQLFVISLLFLVWMLSLFHITVRWFNLSSLDMAQLLSTFNDARYSVGNVNDVQSFAAISRDPAHCPTISGMNSWNSLTKMGVEHTLTLSRLKESPKRSICIYTKSAFNLKWYQNFYVRFTIAQYIGFIRDYFVPFIFYSPSTEK